MEKKFRKKIVSKTIYIPCQRKQCLVSISLVINTPPQKYRNSNRNLIDFNIKTLETVVNSVGHFLEHVGHKVFEQSVRGCLVGQNLRQ